MSNVEIIMIIIIVIKRFILCERRFQESRRRGQRTKFANCFLRKISTIITPSYRSETQLGRFPRDFLDIGLQRQARGQFWSTSGRTAKHFGRGSLAARNPDNPHVRNATVRRHFDFLQHARKCLPFLWYTAAIGTFCSEIVVVDLQISCEL